MLVLKKFLPKNPDNTMTKKIPDSFLASLFAVFLLQWLKQWVRWSSIYGQSEERGHEKCEKQKKSLSRLIQACWCLWTFKYITATSLWIAFDLMAISRKLRCREKNRSYGGDLTFLSYSDTNFFKHQNRFCYFYRYTPLKQPVARKWYESCRQNIALFCFY